jgi:hypothetical protein
VSDQPDIVLNEFGDLSRRARRELLAKGIDPDTAVIEYLNTQSIPIQRPADVTADADVKVVAQPEFASSPEPTPEPAAAAQPVLETEPSPVVAPVPSFADLVSEVPTVPFDGATTTAEIFPASMSKREVRSFLKRNKKASKSAPVEVGDTDDVEIILEPGERHLTLVEDVVVVEAVDVLGEEDQVEAVVVVEAEAEAEAEPAPEPEPEAEPAIASDSYPVYDEVDGIEEEFDDQEEDEGPTTIAEATAALALAEAIAAHNAARIDNGLEIEDDSAAAVAALAEDFDPFSGGVSTSTGSIPTISNALILPTLPEDTGSIVPISTNTGEILITESVSIPSAISQLGAHPESLDTSEVDVIAHDEEIVATDALAPVSATTAVSSYNLNNAVVTVPRRMGDRLPLVLSLTAAGLAVAVVALFVAGYFLGIF